MPRANKGKCKTLSTRFLECLLYVNKAVLPIKLCNFILEKIVSGVAISDGRFQNTALWSFKTFAHIFASNQ